MQAPPVPPPDPSWSTLSSRNVPKTRRSYVLQRDFRVLEREQKVSTLLGSEAFREELENILRGQLEGTGEPKRTRAQSPGAVSPGRADLGHKSRLPAAAAMVGGAGGEPVIPINDLRGASASKYTVAEREHRCKLASVYRLVHMFGWSQLIYNHITACAPGERNTYLVNAFGLLYHEVTASNLVRVTLQGDVIDPGSTQLGINREGFVLHSVIHEARQDIKCVIHLHTNAGIAVSSMNCGLIPASAEALGVGEVSYHNFNDYQDEDEDFESHQIWRERLADDLGPTNKVLILHNHGLVAMGTSIEEAFHIAHKLVKACEVQVAVMSAGLGNILKHSPQGVWPGVGVACMRGVGGACSGSIGSSPRKWRTGDLEFEALMRMLDNKGYNTGYRYKGLGLLEAGTGSPTTNRKDIPTTSGPTRIGQQATRKSRIHWDFLDERKLAPSEPLTKTKHRRHHTTLKQDNEDSSSKTSSESDVLHKEQHQCLSPLQEVQLTAKHVARSTGEAVEKLSANEAQLSRDHSDRYKTESRSLTPLQRAQLTAKEVARSTGEAVEQLGSRLVGTELNHTSLETLPDSAGRYHYGALKRNIAPDSRKLQFKHESTISPLQRAEFTAQRVAESTGESLQKLNSESKCWKHSVHHYEQNGCSNKGEDTAYSTTRSSGCGLKCIQVDSVTYTANELDAADSDGVDSFEKVKQTAEVVAKSTGVAVQKLSSSLSEGAL